MVYCPKCGIVPVDEKDLPVLLPPDAEFRPTGESPLKLCASFVNTSCPKCQGPAQRETDTMDTFMCSSWYFLRYASPHEDKGAFDPRKVKFWLPVDQYTGGAEHANMHLLYARFFVKAIRDLGIIDFDEPFQRLFNQGIIISQSQKMSKSRGNVITPDTYVSQQGADAVRAYLMFVGPWESGGEWIDRGLVGISRWLNRVWSLVLEGYQSHSVDQEAQQELRRLLHKTIKRVTHDMEQFRFNVMLAALMEFTNHLAKVKENGSVSKADWAEAVEKLILMLAPGTPHLAEELWQRTSHAYSIHNQRFPSWDEALTHDEEITLIIQVNGKLRDKVTAPVSLSEAEARELALGREKVRSSTEGKQVANVIYVPGRLVNIVVR